MAHPMYDDPKTPHLKLRKPPHLTTYQPLKEFLHCRAVCNPAEFGALQDIEIHKANVSHGNTIRCA